MKYALLLYAKDESWANASEEERASVYAEFEAFGRLLAERDADRGGEELALSDTATTVRSSGGETVITDGPYAETAEQLGGFFLVEAADLDEALELARACPSAIVEVRPVVVHGA
ncbi:YciI family protein [Stackebrandtia soli]|uniref:YciI family protein n=1 Tax=Stackebrandtia soli TaxID=1892856 RepID=UPI0039E91F79